MTKSCFRFILSSVLLSVAIAAPPAQALTTCQSACNDRHLNTVNSLWQSPHPATTTMPDYRQQVLTALDTLNQCLAACAAEPVVANLAVGKSATASLSSSGYVPARAVDNNVSTYWLAKSTSTHWLRVDLGAAKTLSKVTLAWRNSNYATGYNVQVSADGTTWATVFTTTAGEGGTVEHSFAEVSARYVRINCTRAYNRNGYAIHELGVLGY